MISLIPDCGFWVIPFLGMAAIFAVQFLILLYLILFNRNELKSIVISFIPLQISVIFYFFVLLEVVGNTFYSCDTRTTISNALLLVVIGVHMYLSSYYLKLIDRLDKFWLNTLTAISLFISIALPLLFMIASA